MLLWELCSFEKSDANFCTDLRKDSWWHGSNLMWEERKKIRMYKMIWYLSLSSLPLILLAAVNTSNLSGKKINGERTVNSEVKRALTCDIARLNCSNRILLLPFTKELNKCCSHEIFCMESKLRNKWLNPKAFEKEKHCFCRTALSITHCHEWMKFTLSAQTFDYFL